MKIARWIMLIITLLLAIGVIGCSSETQMDDGTNDVEAETDNSEETPVADNEDQSGGELRVAISAQPPTLDAHNTTAISATYVTGQFYETLLAIDENYEVVPHLAEAVEQSEDGKTITFHLREGIKFHNGKEMLAEDVVASMNRWKDISPSGVPAGIQEGHFSVIDDYTVELEVSESSPLILTSMGASRYAAIMPKEIIEEADSTGVKQFIGTGPFKFVEWKQDQYVHLTKFEEYQSVDSPATGTSGTKEALVDDIYFEAVGDAATQVAGIQTGEYDVVLDLPNEYYKQLKDNSDLNVDVTMYGAMTMVFNKNEGLFKNIKVRQAVNAALDFEEILLASFVNEDLYRANSSYMLKEQTLWFSSDGEELYNENNQEKAKKLLEESGYDGETVRIITTRDYEHIYNTSVVTKEQLENIGMNVELEIYDWPTVSTRTADPTTWDIFPTGYAGRATPLEYPFFNENYVDGPKDEESKKLLNAIETASTQEEATEHWEKLQAYSWEFLPAIKLGDFPKITVMRAEVEGYQYFNAQPMFWNTSNTK